MRVEKRIKYHSPIHKGDYCAGVTVLRVTVKFCIYNFRMEMQVREQVKTLISQEGVKMKELAQKMEILTGRNYSLQNLSHRLSRGTLYYNEVLKIAKILGYSIRFDKIPQ